MNPDGTIQILVVDDEMSIVRLLVDIFEEDNELLFATDGQRALEIARSAHPDLILLDVMMPGIDGFEVCRQLKADPALANIPVIFVTAHLDPEKEIEGLNIGAVDYIIKPINAALVRARVSTHLRLMTAMTQVRMFNESLEDLVALRTEQLKAALESLHRSHEELADSEARATMSTLIASVSHELATPLSNSVLTSEMLTTSSDKLLTGVETGSLKRSELAEFLSDLRFGTDLLRRNLNRARDLLESFKQVAADQASERRREFDLAETVTEILATMAPSLKLHPHRVDVEIPNAIMMNSFPGALGQVVINVINNAYLHAFDGRSDGVVSIRASRIDDTLLLQFEDNGVGIPEEHLAHIFEPFFTTKAGKGGTGLGMVIVRNLVRKSLSGTLNVLSRVGAGTTVEIRAPLVVPLAA